MAQETPSVALEPKQQPGPGIASNNASESRAPQFVGGSIDPGSGNLISSSRSQADQAPPAPPPAVPTTRLATIDTPKPISPALAAAGTFAPGFAGGVAGRVAGGQGVVDATKGTFSDITSGLGFGQKAAPAAAAPVAPGLTAGPNPGGYGGDLAASSPGFGDTATAGVSQFGNAGAPLSLSQTAAAPAATTAGDVASAAAGPLTAGIGSEVIGAATQPGNFFKNLGKPAVYEPAIGAAVGFAIGNFVLPGIGGFVGSAIGSLFCHAAGTMILMADGTRKSIETIKIGEEVYLGGMVVGRGEVLARNMVVYKGTFLEGHHAVFDHEQRRWLRVEDDESAIAWEPKDPTIVYPLVTEKHLLVCDEYICSDLAETDQEDVSPSQRLATLNAATERNTMLCDAAELLWQIDADAAA
jgi:hypothetical protein